MNIFWLDTDVEKCAEDHCDRHVNKMIIEVAQMLCSPFHLYDLSEDAPYRLTHKNHPCTKWVRESLGNWLMLRNLAEALNKEWRYRFNHSDRNHKSYDVIMSLPISKLAYKLPNVGHTPYPLAMPDKYRNGVDRNDLYAVVDAYRNYYIHDKQHLRKYTKREVPEWFKIS